MDPLIRDGSQVRLHYALTVDGDVVENTEGEAPLSYVHGAGRLVRGLEEALAGLAPGDRRTVVIPPEEAHGPRVPERVEVLPRSSFADAEPLAVGDRVSGRGGRATVVAVTDDPITVDRNHPLAGKTLHYAVEIVEVW